MPNCIPCFRKRIKISFDCACRSFRFPWEPTMFIFCLIFVCHDLYLSFRADCLTRRLWHGLASYVFCFRHSSIGHKKKASLRVPREAVGIALYETQREASALRFPLQGAVVLETSYISLDDRFAAQIVYATGRCPPMYRLVTDCRSFHCQFHDLKS